MKRAKLFAIILVILAGLTSFYLIFRDPSSNVASGENGEISELSKQILNKNPIQWVEKAKEQISGVLNDLNSGILAGQNENSLEQINFTDLVAQSMFGKIREADQNGDSLLSKDVFDAKSVDSQNLLAQAVSELEGDNNIFDQTVKTSDLKISQDNSKEAKIAYLREIEKISARHVDDARYSSADQAQQILNNDCFADGGSSLNKEIAANYKILAGEYLNLKVPSDWTNFHAGLISHFKETEAVFGYFSNCSNDPIGASLAIQFFPQLIEQSKLNQNLLVEKHKEMGLE